MLTSSDDTNFTLLAKEHRLGLLMVREGRGVEWWRRSFWDFSPRDVERKLVLMLKAWIGDWCDWMIWYWAHVVAAFIPEWQVCDPLIRTGFHDKDSDILILCLLCTQISETNHWDIWSLQIPHLYTSFTNYAWITSCLTRSCTLCWAGLKLALIRLHLACHVLFYYPTMHDITRRICKLNHAAFVIPWHLLLTEQWLDKIQACDWLIRYTQIFSLLLHPKYAWTKHIAPFLQYPAVTHWCVA